MKLTKNPVKSLYRMVLRFRSERQYCRLLSETRDKYLKYHNRLKARNSDSPILTPQQKKEIDDLWKHRYPKPTNMTYSFHEFYYLANGHYDAHYIPDDLFLTLIDLRFNNQVKGLVFENKCLFAKYFPFVRMPETIAYRINGFWLDENYMPISMGRVCSSVEEENEVVVKIATSTSGGAGVDFLSVNKSARLEEISKSTSNDLVIQKVVRQHKELAKINSNSVNTIRILSLIKDSKVIICSSFLRMSIDESKVDNASFGGITCGILDSGRLKNVAYSIDGRRFDLHPLSGVSFDSIVVPSYQRILDLVPKLHWSFPLFRLISWDFAVDENGDPVLIEANLGAGGIVSHQLNNGPLFGKMQDEILSEVSWTIP